MRAIIISNGNFNIEVLKKHRVPSDIIICADGGSNHLYKSDVTPDMIVGDLDSIDRDVLTYYKSINVEIRKFPSEKDYTDTELAIDLAVEKDARDLILLGSTGTRLDHTLGNIMLLLKLLKRNITAKIIDENNEIYITDKYIEVEKEKDTFVSFLPMFKSCEGVTMTGFKYRTDKIDFNLGSTMGISNEVEGEKGYIDMDSGIALVIKSRDM